MISCISLNHQKLFKKNWVAKSIGTVLSERYNEQILLSIKLLRNRT
jgi:hypothetical protein